MNDIRDIKQTIDSDVVKRIFGNQENGKRYLLELQKQTNIGIPTKEIIKGKNKGEIVLDISPDQLWNIIISTWNYNISKDIIRTIFRGTNKYSQGKLGEESINTLLNERKEKGFGNIKRPFSQGAFDAFVQGLNSENIPRDGKDEKIKIAAVKYRRIKELNTVRNDYLETLIFEKNKNIIPTISHSRGVDFFINGISFDQKVAKSPTKEFIKKYGEDTWKEYAINNPSIVAEYLYKYQDEGRFGAGPRLYVVYLDEDVSPVRIHEIISSIDLMQPYKVTFEYKHVNGGNKTYQTLCFVILLSNNTNN